MYQKKIAAMDMTVVTILIVLVFHLLLYLAIVRKSKK